MDIGTAKPPPSVRARHPHALVDIRDPAETYSVADFVADADAAVARALAGNRLPLLVGGTMLYLRAFREGLAALPPADPAVRQALGEEAARLGWPAMYQRLQQLDPDAATGIHPHNRVRVQRALEVHRLTGRPISRWWAEQTASQAAARLGVRLLEIAVMPESLGSLAQPIEARFDAMLSAGLMDEVAGLMARGDLSADLPSMRSVGYRQIWEHLQGRYDRQTARDRSLAATRALAKRQITWLRRWPQVHRVSSDDPEGAVAAIEALLAASEQPW
jgi:tRNA dimethylallyltransferase